MKRFLSFVVLCSFFTLAGIGYAYTEISKNQDLHIQGADKLLKLKLINRGGNLTLFPSNKQTVEINAKIRVEYKTKAQSDDIMNNFKINAPISGTQLTISAQTKKGNESDFWKWKDKNYPAVNVVIDYTIKVPKNIQIYDLENIGNDKLKDLNGTLIFNAEAGNLDLINVKLRGESAIELGAGNVTLDVNLDDAKKLAAKVETGNITLQTSKSAKFALEASVGMGNIIGNLLSQNVIAKGSLKQSFNEGQVLVILNVGTGNIFVNGK